MTVERSKWNSNQKAYVFFPKIETENTFCNLIAYLFKPKFIDMAKLFRKFYIHAACGL